MKIGNFKLWNSSAVCWWFCTLFFALFMAGQFVIVIPYENKERDALIWSLFTAGGAIVSFILARRASCHRTTKKDSSNDHVA